MNDIMLMTGRQFRIFSIKGIPIKIGMSWFIILGLVIYSLAFNYYPLEFPGKPFIIYLIAGIISSLLLFSSILLHELGHSLTAMKSGIPIDDITLFIFGGVARFGDEAPDAVSEFKIALAGPLVSLIIAIVSIILYFLSANINIGPFLPSIFKHLAILNIIIMGFNLAPGMPLDGGRALRALIWNLTDNPELATKISCWTGGILGVLMILFGFFIIAVGAALNGIWIGIIGYFIASSSKMIYNNVRYSRFLSNSTAGDVMIRRFIAIPAKTILVDAVKDYFIKYPFEILPVINTEPVEGRTENEFAGFIDIKDLSGITPGEWRFRTAGDIAQNKNIASASPNDNIREIIRKMSIGNMSCLPVVEENEFKGIIFHKSIINRAALDKVLKILEEEELITGMQNREQPHRTDVMVIRNLIDDEESEIHNNHE